MLQLNVKTLDLFSFNTVQVAPLLLKAWASREISITTYQTYIIQTTLQLNVKILDLFSFNALQVVPLIGAIDIEWMDK